MNTKPQWIIRADDALRRAAQRAREVAARTGTPVHVLRNGKVVKLEPATETTALREDPATHQPRKH